MIVTRPNYQLPVARGLLAIERQRLALLDHLLAGEATAAALPVLLAHHAETSERVTALEAKLQTLSTAH